MAVLISLAALADVSSSKPRYFTAQESAVWSVPGLPEAAEKQMVNFFNAIRAQYPAHQTSASSPAL